MKPCETSLAVHTDIRFPKIDSVKKFMREKYLSTFDVSPHITHLLLPMFENRFVELLPLLREYIKTLEPIKIIFGDLVLEEKRRFYKIEVSSTILPDIHTKLVEMAQLYRDDAVRTKDIARMSTDYYDVKQKEYINLYGYPRLFELNKPHITLGSCEIDGVDLVGLKGDLETKLEGIVNSEFYLENITVMLHTNADVQSEMNVIFEESFSLKNRS